ncbi:MAG: alanine dehydrogenase, partial [Pseudomonadota bacterium]
MLIGCPTEVKTREYRVGMTPATCREAIAHGHEVIVQSGAGMGAGFPDDAYRDVGVEITGAAEDVFARADMVVKVKEPQPAERKMLREGQILFTYL